MCHWRHHVENLGTVDPECGHVQVLKLGVLDSKLLLWDYIKYIVILLSLFNRRFFVYLNVDMCTGC